MVGKINTQIKIKYMTFIKIEIKNCTQCPFFRRERIYTEDSWEEAYDWYCTKSEDKKISGYVERNDKIPVPEWCEIKI